MGANAWRMSHNPPNKELLDFADEYGILVWDENRHFENNTQYFQDMEDMINRDKNHPSIVIWSLCNEGGCMENPPDVNSSAYIGEIFENIIRKIDNYNTRSISAAMNKQWGDPLSPLLDIQGINYNYDEYDIYHEQYPNQPVISSESCSCITDRGEYANNQTSGHVSAYTDCVWNCWQPVVERKFVAGSFSWTAFDYKGEPYPYDWPTINSHFGVLDIAGFKKDDYFYYKSWWEQNNETVIHIVPNDWNQWELNENVNVWIYTNAYYIDLQLNGVSLTNGRKLVAPQSLYIHSVNYQNGTLEVIGYDKNRTNIGSYSIETTNDAYAINLIAEYPGNMIYADGMDVVLIQVQIVDNKGRIVPSAMNMIEFSISGDGIIYGVANGNPSSHEPDKATQRSAFHGRARVIVQSILNKVGEIKLTANSVGLIGNEITIYTVTPSTKNSLC
eukprot:451015_1